MLGLILVTIRDADPDSLTGPLKPVCIVDRVPPIRVFRKGKSVLTSSNDFI